MEFRQDNATDSTTVTFEEEGKIRTFQKLVELHLDDYITGTDITSGKRIVIYHPGQFELRSMEDALSLIMHL